MTIREPHPDDDMLKLQALLDGELDAAGSIEIERKLANDPRLAAEHKRLVALRSVIRSGALREVAPDGLRARMAALADDASESKSSDPKAPIGATNVVAFPKGEQRKPAMQSQWRRIAASIAAAVVVIVGADAYLRSDADLFGSGVTEIERAVVASHMRGAISGQPVDVVSTDRHTVKPWLAGKVPLATAVADLTADGYALAGGRVDIIDAAPAATLVYRYREHFISVTELARGTARISGETREAINGHPVVMWADDSRRYIAVSDMLPAELDQFVAAFRRAALSAGEGKGQGK